MKWIISRQLPDSPPPQHCASDTISGLTGSVMCIPILPSYISFPHQHHVPQILTRLPLDPASYLTIIRRRRS